MQAEDAFNVLDVVETDYSGKVTSHIVMGRFRSRNCETGITYRVIPPVPKSSGRDAKIDHNWFKRVGRFYMDSGEIKYEEIYENSNLH
jgi:hypothetical protein